MEENDTHYVKTDLEDRANFRNVENHADDDGIINRGPGRTELLADVLGKDTHEIRKVREGGYQGTILFVFRHAGYVWLVKDSYGSCSHCDGYLAADDDESYKKYARSMCRNAYAFESTDDAVRFLHKKSGDGTEMSTFAYGWGPLVDEGIEQLATV